MTEWWVAACVAPYLLAALLWRWLAREHARDVDRLRREVSDLRAEVARLEMTRG